MDSGVFFSGHGILDPTLKKGFTAIPNAVVRAPGLSLAAKGMYMILASYVYQFPAGWHGSLETLAGDANCDVATVPAVSGGTSKLWLNLSAAGGQDVMTRSSGESNPILGLLHDHPVAYRPDSARAIGSVAAGIMLSQALYWDGVIRRSHPENDGWFYKTGQEWEDETGMGRREQETARRILRGKGVLEEKRQGIGGLIYYRINIDNLVSLLESYYADPSDTPTLNSPTHPGNKGVDSRMAESAIPSIQRLQTENLVVVPPLTPPKGAPTTDESIAQPDVAQLANELDVCGRY